MMTSISEIDDCYDGKREESEDKKNDRKKQ
jgi:hypothetical protein